MTLEHVTLSLCQLVLNLRQLPVDMIGTSTYLHVNMPLNYSENTLTHACTHKPWQSPRKQHTMINYMCLHMHTSIHADVATTQMHHPLCLPKARCDRRGGDMSVTVNWGICVKYMFERIFCILTGHDWRVSCPSLFFPVCIQIHIHFLHSSNKETGIYFDAHAKNYRLTNCCSIYFSRLIGGYIYSYHVSRIFSVDRCYWQKFYCNPQSRWPKLEYSPTVSFKTPVSVPLIIITKKFLIQEKNRDVCVLVLFFLIISSAQT